MAASAQVAPLPTRQEVTPPAPESSRASRADVDARGAFAASNCPFAESPLRVSLNRVAFSRPDGSPLQPQIAEALAKVQPVPGDQSIVSVCEIRDRANAALRSEGWVASVQIPPQEITDGVLRLQVVTARIVEVRVRGDAGRYEPFLRRRIAAIQALDP